MWGKAKYVGTGSVNFTTNNEYFILAFGSSTTMLDDANIPRGISNTDFGGGGDWLLLSIVAPGVTQVFP